MKKVDIGMRRCFAIGQTNYCHLEEKEILAVNSYFAGRPFLASESNVAKFEMKLVECCSEHYEGLQSAIVILCC